MAPVEGTVLLVEDDEDTRMVYATMLEHHGYRVVETANGETAVDLARDTRPDLILLDISIPGIDGWEAAKRIRRHGNTAATPLVAVTAHALPSDRRRAEALGFAAYLTKPCEPRRLLEAVREIIG